jgi:hypothetical protein
VKNDVWLVLAAIAGGAGGVIGAVGRAWAVALVGLGVVLVCVALLF